MRIELVGGMGVGKTTLCRVLEETGYNCIYEDLGENPFLADMYDDPEGYRFPTQVWFILSKFHEIQSKLDKTQINILDQAMDNYKAYSRMLFNDGKDPEGLKLVEDFFSYTENQFGHPDLLVYLKASPEVQMKRVKSRNRGFEMNVDLDYLSALRQELDKVVEETKGKGVKMIEIDTDRIFMPDHHKFARELGENIADQLKFCFSDNQAETA